MKKITGCLVVGLLVLSSSVYAGEKGQWTGWLADSKCAANGAKAAHKGCSIKCVDGGADIVFVVDESKKVFKLTSADKIKDLLGDKVVLSGSLDGDTVSVDSARKAE